MTHTIAKVLCLSMALIFGDANLILLGLIIIITCARSAHSQLSFGSPTSNASPNPSSSSPNGPKKETKQSVQFYQKCEKIIKKELKAMKEASLSKEVRLQGSASSLGGPIHFYTIGSRVNYDVPLFSWKSKTNPYVADDIIVLGMYEKNQLNDFMPLGWMSGAFIALRKFSDAGSSPFMAKLYYYVLVAYVRKDYNGGSDIVEWDRFSPKILKNLFQKETDVEVGESFTIETILCSYGTCACAACKCGGINADQIEEGGRMENSTTDIQPSSPMASGERLDDAKEKDELRPSEKAGNESQEDVPDNNRRAPSKGNAQKKRKFHGVASAIAKSSKGSARSKSEASERGKSALATSIAGDNAAVAEAMSHKGASQSYAESRNDSLAEATGGREGASSSSVTRKGTAQSSAQSRGGEVTAEAISINSDEYNYYDTDNESEEDFDGKSLIRDTKKKFSEANQRSDKMKLQSAEDTCLKESGYEVNLTVSEFKLVTDTDTFREENQKMSKRDHPSFLYRNPTRFGIDVDVGLNSSVLIATVIPGFIVPRESCCGLQHNPDSTISKFLRIFKQDCNSDLETQVKRLETAYKKSYVDEMMHTKRLSLQQLRDLVPMILLTVNDEKKTKKGIKYLKKNYNSTASENINRIVAVIVNGAHFAMADGILHKIKILKGLVLNVRTVMTGVFLEFKRCKKDVSDEDCSEEYQERLKMEKKLILGLYYFLKFADGRYAYYKYRASRPIEVFVDFMKTHSASLTKLEYCKSRRIIMNSA